jgi:hypothetical protein
MTMQSCQIWHTGPKGETQLVGTVIRLIGPDGTRPMPPYPAVMQQKSGVPVWLGCADELCEQCWVAVDGQYYNSLHMPTGVESMAALEASAQKRTWTTPWGVTLTTDTTPRHTPGEED